MLYYKKSIYRRKNIYIKNVYILKKLILTHHFFDKSLGVGKLYKMKRVSIAKYLNYI